MTVPRRVRPFLVALALLTSGPLAAQEFVQPPGIPHDKGLTAERIAALRAPGEPLRITRADPDYIGMPVGGLFAGLVYLSGDGRLWLWDIFRVAKEGIDGRPGTYRGRAIIPRDGGAYVEPRTPSAPMAQGFAVAWSQGGLEGRRTLDRAGGWARVDFTGRYPLGTVDYQDPAVPITVRLEAFSPFIPLAAEDSSRPVTVLRYTITNPTDRPVRVELGGWLENPIGTITGPAEQVERRNHTAPVAGGALVVAGWRGARPAGRTDLGTLALALLDPAATAAASVTGATPAEAAFAADGAPPAARPLGAVRAHRELAPGASWSVPALIAWHLALQPLPASSAATGAWYAARWPDAAAVVQDTADDLPRLEALTRRWVGTWYDSTLPVWVLDRTLLNIGTLATTTAFRFGDGRVWGWEGIGACEGTCTHVWGYAQAVARLFPEIERDLRTSTDYGLAFRKGVVQFRGESHGLAVDGQAMVVLRTWREHTMAPDDGFLRPLWPRVQEALQVLMAKDRGDGLLDGAQHNTLDTDWYGTSAWLSGLYLAALRAGEAMALDLGDHAAAIRYGERWRTGSRTLVSTLYNGTYFVNRPDPAKPETINSGSGCHIDQVLGQSWAWQAGLGRILPEAETRSALAALWRFNLTPDVGPWRATREPGRWYALPGEGGMVMTTFPSPDWDFTRAARGTGAWAAMYFNENMSGFEWQVAGHLIHEGQVDQGLHLARLIHDRYAPTRRNPYNEIECSDHYARAMAAYGVFTALSGATWHGPRRHLGFDPRLNPDDFRAAFTAATGWGTVAQQRTATGMTARLTVAHGRVPLASLALRPRGPVTRATVTCAGTPWPVTCEPQPDGTVLLRFAGDRTIATEETLVVTLAD